MVNVWFYWFFFLRNFSLSFSPVYDSHDLIFHLLPSPVSFSQNPGREKRACTVHTLQSSQDSEKLSQLQLLLKLTFQARGSDQGHGVPVSFCGMNILTLFDFMLPMFKISSEFYLNYHLSRAVACGSSIPRDRPTFLSSLNLFLFSDLGHPVIKIVVFSILRKHIFLGVCVSCSAVSNTLQLHGLYLARLLSPRNFPGKNTGVVAISFSRGSFRPRDRTHVLHQQAGS